MNPDTGPVPVSSGTLLATFLNTYRETNLLTGLTGQIWRFQLSGELDFEFDPNTDIPCPVPPCILTFNDAERWIIERLREQGVAAVRDAFDINIATVANIEATFVGTKIPNEVIVVGGHYDTVADSPGANDNASGVAVLLALSERLKQKPPERTVRVLFFVNEEAPFSGGIQMGSRVYADRCRARQDPIVAMISIDGVGCYSNERGSQNYPGLIGWSLPSKGNFIAFGSNMENRPLLDLSVAKFQKHSRFPSIGIASDSKMMARSDHAPFLWRGYPAISVSDTSEFRDDTYHTSRDTPPHLDYEDMTRMAGGFIQMVQTLASTDTVLVDGGM